LHRTIDTRGMIAPKGDKRAKMARRGARGDAQRLVDDAP
jgi:hypothetical protein